jgi:putative acetyltransferase
MTVLTLQKEDPDSPDSRALIAELDRYLSALCPVESNHLLSVEALRDPDVTFLVARVDGRVAGCGAFVSREGGYAEIKRMFVAPEYRRAGLGRRILQELELQIRASGLDTVRLETGIEQPEALQLYLQAGYESRGPFAAYREDSFSVFLEKSLTSAVSARSSLGDDC